MRLFFAAISILMTPGQLPSPQVPVVSPPPVVAPPIPPRPKPVVAPPVVATDDGPAAVAAITMPDGSPVPLAWPLGKPLVLSSHLSVAGTLPGSRVWRASDDWVEANSIRMDGSTVLNVATGRNPRSVTFELTVAKGDLPAQTVHTVNFFPDDTEPGAPAEASARVEPRAENLKPLIVTVLWRTQDTSIVPLLTVDAERQLKALVATLWPAAPGQVIPMYAKAVSEDGLPVAYIADQDGKKLGTVKHPSLARIKAKLDEVRKANP